MTHQLPNDWWEAERRELIRLLDRRLLEAQVGGIQIVNSGDTQPCDRGTAHAPHDWNYNVASGFGPLMVWCPGVVHRESKTFRRIRLNRRRDVSGVSGTGIVAYGVVWPDGSVTLRWDTQVRSTVMYDSIDDVQTITSHGGNTVIEWVDNDDHVIDINDIGWVIEHSDDCRLARFMANCPYTIWAREHVGAKPPHPHGRFKMQIPEMGGMVLDGAVK